MALANETRRMVREAMGVLNLNISSGAGGRLHTALVNDKDQPNDANLEALRGNKDVADLLLFMTGRTAGGPYEKEIAQVLGVVRGQAAPTTPAPPQPPQPPLPAPPTQPSPTIPTTPPPSAGTALLPAGGRVRGQRAPYDSSTSTVWENPPRTLQVTNRTAGNWRHDGKLAIGMDPVDADADLQIAGGGTAEILFVSNLEKKDGQNPEHAHVGVVKLANDNSMGWIQNGFWRNGKRVRTDPTRAMNYLHMDSLGDLSLNRGTLDGKGEEYSQQIVLKYSEKRRMWILGIAAAGVGLAVRGSVSTNDFGDVDDPNPARGELVLIEPLPER